MIWIILSLLGVVCALICIAALTVWFAVAIAQALAGCASKVLASFSDGHAIFGLLYLIPAGFLLYAIGEGLRLAVSFYVAVWGH